MARTQKRLVKKVEVNETNQESKPDRIKKKVQALYSIKPWIAEEIAKEGGEKQ